MSEPAISSARVMRCGNRLCNFAHAQNSGSLPAFLPSDAGSIEYRGQERACGLAVETDTHECHRLDHAESMVQTPPEQFPVSGGEKEARPPEGRSRSD